MPETWIDKELAGCVFKDARLGIRFESLVRRLAVGIGESIPMACEDWANTKAAYRFLSNGRVDEGAILGGHFQATRARFSQTNGTVLVLHDTTEFIYSSEDTKSIGVTTKVESGSRDKEGRPRMHTVCGILMHSSLAVTMEGLPLGISAIKFWTRKKFKGTNALKRHINPTRVPIEEKESVRWLENLKQSTTLLGDASRCVHIGDREADIFELFCSAQEAGTHFLVRTCNDRLAGGEKRRVSEEMKSAKISGKHRIQVRDKENNFSEAVIDVRYRRIEVLPPIGKQDRYPGLMLTVIYAQECEKPKGRERINWKLITDLPVESFDEALEKIQWYALRWKIETFHKILKSGCKAEELKLRTAERLVNLISIFCILSWRIFWMTMINRSTTKASPKVALTDLEIRLLDKLVQGRSKHVANSLSSYLIKIARLGGYLDRSNDLPPGNTVMWRGLSRLTDIELGFQMGAKLVGN